MKCTPIDLFLLMGCVAVWPSTFVALPLLGASAGVRHTDTKNRRVCAQAAGAQKYA